MKKWLNGLLAAVMLLGLTACGVKGPLYFPQETQPTTDSTSE
ncbi:LPS translocon maturation chaperone LptM [Pasteurella testudinis]